MKIRFTHSCHESCGHKAQAHKIKNKNENEENSRATTTDCFTLKYIYNFQWSFTFSYLVCYPLVLKFASTTIETRNKQQRNEEHLSFTHTIPIWEYIIYIQFIHILKATCTIRTGTLLLLGIQENIISVQLH